MNDLMRKTKRELVALIHDIEGQLNSIREINAGLEEEKLDPKTTMEAMRGECQDLHGKLDEARASASQADAEASAAAKSLEVLNGEKKDLLARTSQMREDIKRLQQKNDILAGEKSVMQKAFAELEKDLMETKVQLEKRESQYRSQYDLFRSFVDDDLKKILLIDTTYAVIYVNRSAGQALGVGEDGDIAGKRIFDFMAFKDAIKVKEKIDKAFLEGDTEKAKKVNFRCEDGRTREFKLKMSRVRYQDRPSVKIRIK